MSTKRKRPPKGRQPQTAKAVPAPRRRPGWIGALLGAGLVALVAGVIAFSLLKGGPEKSSVGLPNTSDYHSLLVDPNDPAKLMLGTHDGVYVSTDSGGHWHFDGLSGSDAMNLARPRGATIWLAGHGVFKKSTDAGKSWSDVKPSGLPGLDIHGFAVDPRNAKALYAAVAGKGLYRSADAGKSFSAVSDNVGGAVMALAVMPDGRILAGDMGQGLLESTNGVSWKTALRAQVMGLAVDPGDPTRLLATGQGIALSTDGGHNWRPVLDLPAGAGPVAWSQSNPEIAYAVGFDKVLYKSDDAGASWTPVGEGDGSQ